MIAELMKKISFFFQQDKWILFLSYQAYYASHFSVYDNFQN